MHESTNHKTEASPNRRVAWNKGLTLSETTRERMRLAKLGTVHTMTTRRKMSMSHTGKGHSAETMKLLSQKLAGKPKCEEHKRRISVAQKRRHAANKALKAIEEAHKKTGTLYGHQPSHPNPCVARYFHQTIDRKQHSREKKTRAEVLKMYKALLREYRRLQTELSPWMRAFEVKNGRKPRLTDVEETQIDWLVMNFKQYLLMRDKLLRDVPYLRKAMVQAPNDTPEATPPHASTYERSVSPSWQSDGVWTRDLEPESEEARNLTARLERLEMLATSSLPSDRVKNALSAAIQYKQKSTTKCNHGSPLHSKTERMSIKETNSEVGMSLPLLVFDEWYRCRLHNQKRWQPYRPRKRAQDDYVHLLEETRESYPVVDLVKN